MLPKGSTWATCDSFKATIEEHFSARPERGELDTATGVESRSRLGAVAYEQVSGYDCPNEVDWTGQIYKRVAVLTAGRRSKLETLARCYLLGRLAPRMNQRRHVGGACGWSVA